MKGKYFYGVINKFVTGVINKNHSLNLDGLTTVDYQSLAAVVAEKEVKDYHKLPKEETVRELVSHQQTIEKIMSETSILPVKFGTFLKDEKEVTSVLEKGYFFLCNALREIEDKIELDLVCFWDDQKAAQMAYQGSSKVRNLQEKITKKKDVTFEDKIALGKLIDGYLNSKREKLRDQILKTLKKEAVENCSHALADVNMLLNQAFLVKKKRQKAFDHALNGLDSKFADLLNFRLVGPLPPYSFATVVVDVLDKEEVEKAKKVLRVDGKVSGGEIKKAYNKLAYTLHPDHGGNPIKFELITKSYKLLKEFAEHGQIGIHLYLWEER